MGILMVEHIRQIDQLVSVGILSFIIGFAIGAILMAALNSDKKDRKECKCKLK